MSKHATQLSVILVDEIFGELPSRVFGALAFHGRLSFSRLAYRTQLSPTEVKHGLSVLIQQHLVLWYDQENTGQASYEADIANSYALARSCKYAPLVQDRLGDLACDIISNVLILGHVRVLDLVHTYFPRSGEHGPFHEIIPIDSSLDLDGKIPAGPYGLTGDDTPTVELFQSTTSDLLRAGLLYPVHESHFRPAADNLTEAEHIVPLDTRISGKKVQQAAWQSAVSKKLDEWKYGSEAAAERLAPQKSTKRAFEDGEEQLSNKKRKLTNKSSNGMDDAGGEPFSVEASWLDNEMIIRVNHEKFANLMRNRQLVALVEESIGSTTAKVYAELLRNAEPQLRKCKNEVDVDQDDDDEVDLTTLPKVSTDGLSHLLHDLPDLADAIGCADPQRVNLNLLDHPKKVKRRRKANGSNPEEALVEGAASSDESEDNTDDSRSDITEVDHDSDSTGGDADYSNRRKHKTPDTTPDTTPKMKDPESPLHILRQHLYLLTEHPHRFLIRIPGTLTAPEKWAIPYPTLAQTLLHNALLSITTSRFGPLAGRLFRILSSSPPPKLDEKALVLLSLIPQKPMRTLLHSMHRAGHICLQELPKDGNSRRPGTTLFFWFFDADRMRRRVLEESYKAMGNLVRRARVEREAVKRVVEKSERTDVVGREKEFLGEEELAALEGWRGTEERIWGEVQRLDELVAVLRDF